MGKGRIERACRGRGEAKGKGEGEGEGIGKRDRGESGCIRQGEGKQEEG